MHQAADRVKQEHLKTQPRRSLSVLSKVTAVALLGQALAIAVQMLITLLLHGTFDPGFFIFMLPALLVAGFVVSRVRRAPALGSGVALLTATLWLFAPDYQYDLTHPGGNVIDFILVVLILAFALVAKVAGVGATIQNYQSAEPRTPQGLRPFLTALSGFVVGMIVIALIVAANPPSGSVSTNSGGEPTVHIGGVHFVQDIVLVPKGSKLRIVNDIRRLVYALRPPTLDELGLVGAIQQYAGQCSMHNETDGTTEQTDADLRVIVEVAECFPALPAAVEVAAYRIVQEALTNVVRHAQARTCVVRLSLLDGLRLEITDDGVGLPAKQQAGVGLLSMRERATEVGGSCAVESASGHGTRVMVKLPLPKE